MIDSAKQAVLGLVRLTGWELHKVDRLEQDPPPLYDDPWEALWCMRAGKRAAFKCPLDQCVRPFGQSFGAWEHLTETAKEYVGGQCNSYEHSILRRYFDVFKPVAASEAIIGFTMSSLENLPPYAALCLPWTPMNVARLIKGAQESLAKENAEHGAPGLTVGNGTKYFGPVCQDKGELEFRRIITLVHAIRERGYDRIHGDVDVTILQRGDEFRYLKIGAGYHRAAVMAAMDYETIPAIARFPFTINVDHAGYWPQVRRGVWNRGDAVRYFNHLFDFDSYAWAQKRGLLAGDAGARCPSEFV